MSRRHCKNLGCGLPALPEQDFCPLCQNHAKEQAHLFKALHPPIPTLSDQLEIQYTPNPEPAKEVPLSGGASPYYQVPVRAPISRQDPYLAECGDIIESLNMSFAEGNAFKAIWRMAAARTLGLKKKGIDAVYDAEKLVFFAERVLATEQQRKADAEKAEAEAKIELERQRAIRDTL